MPRILVVDDEPDGLELLSEWLQSQGHSVLTCDDAEQTLELAQAHRPDLIILDVVMPGVDGIQTCRALRRKAETQNIPVLLLTAHDPLAGRIAGLRAGADDFLAKPINFPELQTRIDSLLGGSSTFVEHGHHLIDEVIGGIIPTLSCNLAWLLELEPQKQSLVTRSIMTSRQASARHAFIETLAETHPNGAYSLAESNHPLARALLTGRNDYNLTLTNVQQINDSALYKAATELDIYFLTLLPLQSRRTPLGLLVIGSLEPLDVDTRRGQQIISAIRNQATSAVNNVRLTRLLAEREAESNRERAFRQTLLDTMGDGLLVHDGTGRIHFVNQRLASMTGYPQEDILSRRVTDLFHPDWHGRITELLSVREDANSRVSIEAKLQRAHGETISVLLTQAARPVMQNEQGNEYVIVLTDLSERRAREAALDRQVHHMTALSRASEMVTSSLESDRIIDLILEEACRALNATHAALIMPISNQSDLLIYAVAGPQADELKGSSFNPTGNVLSHVLLTGHIVIGRNLSVNQHTHDLDAITGEFSQSYIAVPLVIQDDVGGVLTVIDEQPNLFDRKDLELLQSLASTASLAIENNNLYTESQQRIRDLTLLLRASEATSSAFAIEEVVEEIAYQLMETLEIDYCLVASWDDEENLLTRLGETASIHAPTGVARRLRLNDHPLSEAVIRSASTTMFSTINSDLPLEAYGTLMNNKLSSLILVPIVTEGYVAGVVELYDLAQHQTFNRADLERIESIAEAWLDQLPNDVNWYDPKYLEELCYRLRKTSGLGWSTVLKHVTGDQLEVVFEAGQATWSLSEGPTISINEDSLFWTALQDYIPFSSTMEDENFTLHDREVLPILERGVMLVAPLMARGAAIGLVIAVDTSPKRQFDMSELSLIQAIANVTGHALENAHLFAQLSQRASQLEMAYNHLREADRVKDEVIQNVSHELRTPLTLIMGYAELLVDGDLGELRPEQYEAIATINEKSIQLSRLVEDILTVRLIESEKVRRSPALLSEVADVAIRSIRAQADRLNIKIVTDFEKHDRAANINKSRMIQVFENLLSNAIKFSDGGTEVQVAIEDLDDAVEVRVIDQGIGIPTEEHDKVWWRFYQVDGSTTRQFGGTGLGLAVVRQLVEQHGGRVWLTSAPGEGSTFGFIMPLMDE